MKKMGAGREDVESRRPPGYDTEIVAVPVAK
jgi:hypothetical protein